MEARNVWLSRSESSGCCSIPDCKASLKNAEYKTCSGWRRRRRKILFSYHCNHQPFSMQLRPNSFRQLLRESYVKRLSMFGFSLGYSRPRRLRSTEATFLSTNRCVCCVFRHSKSKLIWKCDWEMGSRTPSLRTRSTNPSFGDQNWSSRWQVSCSIRFALKKRKHGFLTSLCHIRRSSRNIFKCLKAYIQFQTHSKMLICCDHPIKAK